MKYQPNIDGLRAIAITGVLIFHAFPTALPGGYLGVDVFFVISGYLITRIIKDEINSSTFTIAGFYARRIRRIFPALLLVLSVTWLLAWGLLNPIEFRQLGKSLVFSTFFANNFLLVSQAGYFDIDAELKPLLHLWSLSVEEQFYLIWPLLLFLALKRLPRYFVFPVAVLLALSFLLYLLHVFSNQNEAFYLPQYRFWELLSGAVLSLKVSDTRNKIYSNSTIGLGCIFTAYLLGESQNSFQPLMLVLAVAGAVMILGDAKNKSATKGFLALPVLVWIGLISYPLYLWHWPLLSLIRIIYQAPSNSLIITIVALSVFLAYLTYRFLELPIRTYRLSSSRPTRATLVIGISLLLSVGILGELTQKNQGFPSRVNRHDSVNLEWGKSRIFDPECAKLFSIFGDYCLISGKGNITNIIIGDSHANHFFPGISSRFNEGPTLQIQGPFKPGTLESFQHNIDVIKNNDNVHRVFVAYHHGRMGQPDDPFIDLIDKLLTELTKQSKSIYFVIDNPEFEFDARFCTERPAFAKQLTGENITDLTCSTSLAYIYKKRIAYNQFIQKISAKFPTLIFIDTFSPFCNAERCTAMLDGATAFRDRHHLTVAGSVFAIANAQLSKIPPTP